MLRFSGLQSPFHTVHSIHKGPFGLTTFLWKNGSPCARPKRRSVDMARRCLTRAVLPTHPNTSAASRCTPNPHSQCCGRWWLLLGCLLKAFASAVSAHGKATPYPSLASQVGFLNSLTFRPQLRCSCFLEAKAPLIFLLPP